VWGPSPSIAMVLDRHSQAQGSHVTDMEDSGHYATDCDDDVRREEAPGEVPGIPCGDDQTMGIVPKGLSAMASVDEMIMDGTNQHSDIQSSCDRAADQTDRVHTLRDRDAWSPETGAQAEGWETEVCGISAAVGVELHPPMWDCDPNIRTEFHIEEDAGARQQSVPHGAEAGDPDHGDHMEGEGGEGRLETMARHKDLDRGDGLPVEGCSSQVHHVNHMAGQSIWDFGTEALLRRKSFWESVPDLLQVDSLPSLVM
jgi:hypothetical protein